MSKLEYKPIFKSHDLQGNRPFPPVYGTGITGVTSSSAVTFDQNERPSQINE